MTEGLTSGVPPNALYDGPTLPQLAGDGGAQGVLVWDTSTPLTPRAAIAGHRMAGTAAGGGELRAAVTDA